MFFDLVPDAYYPLDHIAEDAGSPLLLQNPQNSVAATIATVLLALVSCILLIAGVLSHEANAEQKESTAVAALRQRLAALEDEVEELREAQNEKGKELDDGLTLLAMSIADHEEKQKEQKERLEALDTRLDLSIQLLGDALTKLVEKKVTAMEARIPRPARVIEIKMDTIPLDAENHTWNSLQDTRLILHWNQIPEGMSVESTPLGRMGGVVPVPYVHLVPAGMKAILSKAEVWHGTPGLTSTIDCTAALRKFFDE
jgi:hypothetical protein